MSASASDWKQDLSWKSKLTPEIEAKIKELEKNEPKYHAKILLLFAIWLGFGAVAVYVPYLWVRIPCWIMMGFAMHGLGVFMHEGAHNMLFGGAIDRVIGFFCGLPLLFSCSNYRATHILHHRYENTDKDPDNLEANMPFKPLRWLVFYGWFIVGMPMYVSLLVLVGPFRAETWKERFACVLETTLMVGTYYGVYLAVTNYGLWDVFFNGWLMGLAAAIIIANVRGLAEHTILHHTDPPNQLKSTRAIRTNGFIRFFFNNQNYHLEHHLFPRVPWYNLGKVHELMRPIYEAEQAAVCPTYGQYLATAFRYGPTKHVRYENGRTILDTSANDGKLADSRA